MEKVNILSMIIAVLIPTIIGFVYYHPALFGKAWMSALGMTEEQQKKANMPVIMIISLVMSFLLAFFLINFNNAPGQEGEFDTFGHGAFHGLFLSIVIVIPVFVTNGLFEQRSWKLMGINVLYWTITLAVMGGILDAMNHWPNTI